MRHAQTLTGLFQKWQVEGAYIAGEEFWCCCPFHSEKRAAFSVNLETGKWHCLACHVKGNTLTSLVAAMEGINTRKAEDVLEQFGLDTVANLKQEVRELLRAKLSRHVDRLGEDTNRTNEWKKTDGIIPGYLIDRGFTKEILDEYHIGFDKRNGTVVIPVFEQKTCRFVYTRITWKKKNKKLPSYNYPIGIDKSFYLWGMTRKPEWYTDRTVILTEGSLDALWLRQHGYENAMAILGSYISWDQIRRVESMCPDKIILAFDNDKAGYDCTVSASRMLLKQGFGKCYYLRYPKGVNDPASASPEQLERMFRKRKSVRSLVWGIQPSKRMTTLLAV